MSLLCYNRTAEESYSMGCKEHKLKTQRKGLDNWKHWLRPLVCLQHRLPATASYHLTDAPSWLQSISYCTSLYITTHAVVKPAWSSWPWMLILFSSFSSFLFSNPSLLQRKKEYQKTPKPIHYPP